MSASSHQAELSSVRSQLEELRARVEKIALTYQGTPDSAVAAELFEADRALTTAGFWPTPLTTAATASTSSRSKT